MYIYDQWIKHTKSGCIRKHLEIRETITETKETIIKKGTKFK